MHIRGKIFLQFFSSWTLMPVALLLAQLTEIAQLPEFIAAILVTASMAPIQIYVNEVFAPMAVRYNQRLDFKHSVEIGLAALGLTGWLVYRLQVALFPSLLILAFAQGYVWFSYRASRRVLEYQADSTIGGRYSYLIGSIIPLTFLFLVLSYWLLERAGLHDPSFLYLLILLPNATQYFYTRYGWMANKRQSPQAIGDLNPKREPYIGLALFGFAMLMALAAQHWKIELAGTAVGFAAVSIYLISPFSSMWLIHAKSRYMTKVRPEPSSLLFWAMPCVVTLTWFLEVDKVWLVFLLALVTQVLTFKFITDIRLRRIIRP